MPVAEQKSGSLRRKTWEETCFATANEEFFFFFLQSEGFLSLFPHTQCVPFHGAEKMLNFVLWSNFDLSQLY